MLGVPKKGKLVEGTNLPILRLILNAIPSNVVPTGELKPTSEPCHTTVSGHGLNRKSDMDGSLLLFGLNRALDGTLLHVFFSNKSVPGSVGCGI